MIEWSRPARDDLIRIQNVTASKSGYAVALEATTSINDAANRLDKLMNGSRPGRLGIGEREKPVHLGTKKSEFIIFFDDDGNGNIKILNVKHYLEQYP